MTSKNSSSTEVRTVEPTMLVDGAGSLSQFRDFTEWYEAMEGAWQTGESIRPVVIGYYAACPSCDWAEPGTHKTREEAEEVKHVCVY